MTSQIEPTVFPLPENQFGEGAFLAVRNHVDCAGWNLKTIVVVLGEPATGERHPLVDCDIVLLCLCETCS